MLAGVNRVQRWIMRTRVRVPMHNAVLEGNRFGRAYDCEYFTSCRLSANIPWRYPSFLQCRSDHRARACVWVCDLSLFSYRRLAHDEQDMTKLRYTKIPFILWSPAETNGNSYSQSFLLYITCFFFGFFSSTLMWTSHDVIRERVRPQ